MDYCPGGDLTAGLKSERAALRLLAGVAAAVEAVVTAAAQPAHANLALSHVLLDANGKPKLAGWGYARAKRLANKKRGLSERDDVRALAAMLYEMMYADRWDLKRKTWPEEPRISDATRALIVNVLGAKTKNVPELTVFRYDIAAARRLVPQCTAALMPVKNNQRREQFLGADLDSIRGLTAAREADESSEQRQGVEMVKGPDAARNRPQAPQVNGEVRSLPQSVAAKSTGPVPKVVKDAAPSLPFEELTDATVVDIVKRITSAEVVPFNPNDVDILVDACTQSPEMPEKIFKALFMLKISKNPIVAFKSIMLIHQLLAEGPAKLTALAITHDGFLSWAESEWNRERIPNKTGKPHMLSYCFAPGEVAWYMAIVRKRIVVHAKFAQVFSTHWVPRPDGLPTLEATRREAFRSVLEIVEKCNVLLRKLLASKDPTAILKQSAVPGLAAELAKAYQAICYMYATSDQREKVELRPELSIAHKSTKIALDAVRANPTIAAGCPSSALLALLDEPAVTFDIQDLVSGLKKKKKRKKKKTSVAQEKLESVANGRDSSPEPTAAKQDTADNIVMERRSSDPKEAEEIITVVDSIDEKPKKLKKRRNVVESITRALPAQQSVLDGDVPDIERSERPLPLANRNIAPVIGMEKLSLSIRKGAPRNQYVTEPRPTPRPITGDRPFRPPARGRSNSPRDVTRNRVTTTRRYQQIRNESSDSESESPVRGRVANGNGRHQNAKNLPSRRRKGNAPQEDAESESDSESSEDRVPPRTRRAKKSKTKKQRKSETESDTASSDNSGSDEAEGRSRRKRSPKKGKGEQSRPRGRSPKKVYVDEKKIPFDKEPPTKKKSAAKKKPAAPVETENGYSGGSKEALAAAASGKKTPNINPNFEVAPYEVQFGPQIGSGGFGVVFKAKFRGETVAVKKIHAHALSNASSVGEFQSEVAVLCTLRHPNILRFVGACTKPPNLMIITEFMARGTLFDVLHQSQMRVTWPMRKKFALDTCKGMRYLHDSKLLHRDLKSSNLMLDKDFNCKVGDFGLTRISRGAAAVQMTGQCGTFQYMAVEVLANKPYSEKADVFSFGILLWEMVARKLPYFGMQPMQVGIAVLQQGMRPPIPPKCPAPLAKLMRACWDSDPNRRPSFEQLVQALEAMPE